VPNYGYEEAVRYLHVRRGNLYYWMRPSIGLVKPEDRSNRLLSFKNMVECYVINGLREIHDVKLPEIRSGVQYLLDKFESRHPLADYELKTDGRYIFFWHRDEYLNVSLRGQTGFKTILDTYLRRLERDWGKGNWVLHPFTSRKQLKSKEDHPRVVSMNPNICFGLPTLQGTRITVPTLVSRHLGGDSFEVLAKSYGRPEGEIREAVLWEIGKAA
jgi:uncharacterized protein (DUF433 family)